MYTIAKRLLPERVIRALRAHRVRRNRREILRASTRHETTVLVPDNGVEHYYHFLFDLALPLYLVVSNAPPDARFIVDTTGPFLPRLIQLFPGRVTLAPDGPPAGASRHLLLGLNPFLVDADGRALMSFSQYVPRALGIQQTTAVNRVLLIERLPPEEFFKTAAISRGGGASRRSIPNHRELADSLAKHIRPPLQFDNVQLEKTAFEQQIRLFSEAAVVIGQHGAGLANCLWMPKGSLVVELSSDPAKSHFHTISQAMGHRYLLHRTDSPHASVNVREFTSTLETAGVF